MSSGIHYYLSRESKEKDIARIQDALSKAISREEAAYRNLVGAKRFADDLRNDLHRAEAAQVLKGVE